MLVLALTAGAAAQDDGDETQVAQAPAPTQRLTPEMIDRSIALAGEYLINNQLPDGRFRYEFNFVENREVDSSNSVRESGALWGLAAWNRKHPTPRAAAAIERGLAFFRAHEKRTATKLTYPTYPGERYVKTNMLGLLILALVDYTQSEGIGDNERHDARKQLERYVPFLLSLRRADGHFAGVYEPDTGAGVGRSNPYADGEALLALLRAAPLLGMQDLREQLDESAYIMYQDYVVRARVADADSDLTKGFYQWGSMAFFELHELGWDDENRFARRTVELAHWMIDVHQTLRRTRNTAYAHEGIAVAYELARRLDDRKSMEKFRGVMEEAFLKLMSWQVGGPIPNEFLLQHPTQDPRAVGGVMNGASDPVLRIDVTQHQLHAMELARRFVFRDAP